MIIATVLVIMEYSQKGFVLWFTGLSGAGKTTLACAVKQSLLERGIVCEHVDGDKFRQAVTSSLGFSAEDLSLIHI